MAQENTPEEIKDQIISSMGPDFGSLFYEFRNEILTITYMWDEYEELYGTKESRIDILNESAPTFFYLVEKVMRENILLGITRLTDPPVMNGKKNVSINAIPDFLNDTDLKSQINKKLKILKSSTQFCRDWRNRHIAHTDYNLRIDSQAKPLEASTRKKIKQALDEIQNVFNVISSKFINTTYMFDALRSRDGALDLLYTLEGGLMYENECKEKGLRYVDQKWQSRI